MANAKHDDNNVPTLLGVDDVTGLPVAVQVDSSGRIKATATLSGGVTGPGSSTDNAIARFDGTGGSTIQNSVVTIADTTGNMAGMQKITIGVAGSATGSLELKGTTSGTVTVKVADAAGTWTMTLPTSTGSSGQVLQTDGSGTTSWATASSGGITWTEVTGTTQSAAINNGYITNNASLVTVTIPTTAAVGSIVRVAGYGAGGWKIAQNASESINFGNLTSTVGTGGSISSSHKYDAVELICVVADTTWSVISSVGTIIIT